MNSVPQRFNCPRRMIALQHAEDDWEHVRWREDRGDTWPTASPKPRTCSYCGGVHPDDVIPLLVAGWQVEPTTKNYKFYLNAPDGTSALPPVKVYLQHWTQEQVQRADAVLRARYEMQGNQHRND